jgi:hypothetical protein
VKTEQIKIFAAWLDDFERGLLDAKCVLEEMLDSGEQLDSIEKDTAEELSRVLDQIGETHCVVSDLRVNSLRKLVRAIREVPALAAAA